MTADALQFDRRFQSLERAHGRATEVVVVGRTENLRRYRVTFHDGHVANLVIAAKAAFETRAAV